MSLFQQRVEFRKMKPKMRTLIGTFAAAMLAASAAFAAEDEGNIKSIDQDNLTITLDNGKVYKLPGEFDIELIEAGMPVLLAYDRVGDTNLITDMEFSN